MQNPMTVQNEVLGLNEAAALLRIHPETLRQLAKKKVIRGSKFARWRFIKADLLDDIRNFYNKERINDKITGKQIWVSTNPVNIGELELPHQMEEEYNEALGRTTKSKHNNSMTK